MDTTYEMQGVKDRERWIEWDGVAAKRDGKGRRRVVKEGKVQRDKEKRGKGKTFKQLDTLRKEKEQEEGNGQTVWLRGQKGSEKWKE